MIMIEEQGGGTAHTAELSPKELVLTWFTTGVSTPEGRAMTTDDFRWQGPPSTAFLFGTEDAALHGDDMRYLKALDLALYADYDETTSGEANTHFVIAEGDTVVWEFDASFTGHDGERYTNQYCISVTVRDGKIAYLREHADTLHNYQVLMGTPAKLLAVMGRLAEHRAELAA